MNAFSRLVSALTKLASVIAAIMLVAMVGLIFIEIVLRNFFGASTYSADEFVGYGIAALTFLALGQAFKQGTIIRVDTIIALSDRLPRLRRVLELGCAAATLATFGLAIVYFGKSAWAAYVNGYTTGTMTDIPQWIPETVLLVGLAVFWLQMLDYFLQIIQGTASPQTIQSATE